MPRPKKPLKQRASGVWFVQITGPNGQRLTKSLETKDSMQAAARAAQALEELNVQAFGPPQQKWRADTPGTEWDIPTLPDGSNDYANAKARAITASEVLEPEQLRGMTWLDLAREAEQRKRRREGTPYSDGWHKDLQQSIKSCPFNPEEITPQLIRDWIMQLEGKDLAGKTIELRVGRLAAVYNACIKTGLLAGRANPFLQVDFQSFAQNHLETALEEDYRKFFELSSTWPREQRLVHEMQIYMGFRVSEVVGTDRSAFDPEAGTFTTGVKLRRGEPKRTLPLPPSLVQELKDFNFDWCKAGVINKRLKLIRPELSSHSWRHGWKRLSRDVGMDSVKGEFFLGHSLRGMEGVYGDGYSTESLRECAEKVWQRVDTWR